MNEPGAAIDAIPAASRSDEPPDPESTSFWITEGTGWRNDG